MVDLTQVDLKSIIDLGTSGMLLVFLIVVWRRLNQVTDMLIMVRKELTDLKSSLVERNIDIKGMG